MKKINNYYDVYNFLNIINRRIGKLYRFTGYSPLPSNFEIDEKKIEDVLILNQMADNSVMPYFLTKNKKEIKNCFKCSLKNCIYIIKHRPFEKYVSEEFAKKLTDYFNIRKDLSDLIMKDIKKVDADETELYREIYNLNPILGSLLEELFEHKVDYDLIFEKIESDYHLFYTDKLKLLEKKKIKQQNQIQNTTEKNIQKIKNIQKERKNIEKNVKNAQKMRKTQEIQKIKAEHIRLKKENINKEKQ